MSNIRSEVSNEREVSRCNSSSLWSFFIDLTQKSVMSQRYCSNKKDNNHNIFHLSKLGRDLELQNRNIVLLNSPKVFYKSRTLCQTLGLRYQMKEKYQDATAFCYGHLFIDLTQKTVISHKYCSDKIGNHQNIFQLSI